MTPNQYHLTQYLHWALIAAHKIFDPDCDQITLVMDLESRTASTTYRLRGSKKKIPAIERKSGKGGKS